MLFEEDNNMREFGKSTGYVFSYFLFTTLLYLTLSLLDKLPPDWSYFHIMGITMLLVLGGAAVQRL